jgi:hypothetical protein
MNPEQVKDHRKKELEKALGRLDEYVVLCTRLKVFFPTYVMSFSQINWLLNQPNNRTYRNMALVQA